MELLKYFPGECKVPSRLSSGKCNFVYWQVLGIAGNSCFPIRRRAPGKYFCETETKWNIVRFI